MSLKVLKFFKCSIVVMIYIYIMASLLSYDSNDNSINVYSMEKVSNLGGDLGALIAGFIYQYVGFLIFPIFFSHIVSIFSFRKKRVKYILILFSLSNLTVFLTYYPYIYHNWLFNNYAGLLGILIKMYISIDVYKYFDIIKYVTCVVFCLSNYFLIVSLNTTIIYIKQYAIRITRLIIKTLRIFVCFFVLSFSLIKKIYFTYKKIYAFLSPLLFFRKNRISDKRNFPSLEFDLSDALDSTKVSIDSCDPSIHKKIYRDSNNYDSDASLERLDVAHDHDCNYNTCFEGACGDGIYHDDAVCNNNQVNYIPDKDGEFIENIDDLSDSDQSHFEEENEDNSTVLFEKNRKSKISLGSDIKLPNTNFLTVSHNNVYCVEDLDKKARTLEQTLLDFGVKGSVNCFYVGPVVTRYEFEPIAGTKSSRIIGLAGDIARSMKAKSARVSVITGKDALGIELPNENRETVFLKDLLDSEEYTSSMFDLPIALGKGIDGKPIIVDLAKMPHLLIAGTTGSGKSVGVNAMILSLLYKLKPEVCRFIFIDPKMLELSVYDNIPNLLAPVVTNPKKAIVTLKWVVLEMERRYKIMSKLGVRNIKGFNKIVADYNNKGVSTIFQKSLKGFDKVSGENIYENYECDAEIMPFIIVVVDEMADLMIVAGKEIESSIQRLAQMARAAGIHIIMSTQRPSVDVITGVIKANFPTRISFSVSSRIDSRTILGEQGAEQLLGMGDMLYMSPGLPIQRIHAPFVSDKEVNRVVSYLKVQGQVDYVSELKDIIIEEGLNSCITSNSIGNRGVLSYSDNEDDEILYKKAIEVILNDEKVSISYIQRQLKIGYNRAANIIERMEEEGVISKPNSIGKRDILIQDYRDA